MSERCEIPRSNPTPAEIRDILTSARRIAVVGHSDDPGRDSYRVGRYMASHGFEVFAANPNARSTPELKFYPDLASVPGPIDMVNVFRRPRDIPPHVPDILAAKPQVVWLQLGIAHQEAAETLARAGIRVVQDRCLMVEHRRLA